MADGRGPQLRLSGGDLRGRRLETAPGVRPTGGRVREALFSIWQPRLQGSRILDLFAGSGAIGLEALSRGARRADFVEASPKVLACLRRNLALADDLEAVLHRGRLPEWLQRQRPEPFDLVFADPPYRFDDFSRLLAAIPPWVADGGAVVVEHSSRVDLPEVGALVEVDQRTYGESRLSFFAVPPGSGNRARG